MNLNEYQNAASTTANYPTTNNMGLYYTALGMSGEAGEICNKVKKIIRDSSGVLSEEKRQELKGEAGDVLWYISEFARMLGFTLDEVGQDNITKLASRQARGVISGSGDNR
jgi:NTP pyrophosphatase (non-canonical NTP hydrolase)